MRRAHRPIALVLLLMAVLCSPAGVCAIDATAATLQHAAPAHAHACCKSVNGTLLAAHARSCCSKPRAGFLSVFRFTLQKQALPSILDIAEGWMPKTLVTDGAGFDRRWAPLVLRI